MRDRKIVENNGVPEYATLADVPDATTWSGLCFIQDTKKTYRSDGNILHEHGTIRQVTWANRGLAADHAGETAFIIDYGINGAKFFNANGKWIPEKGIQYNELAPIAAGVTSAFSGAESSTARGATFNGWGYTYLRDNLTQFDTVTIKEIKRAAGLTGTDLWSTIKVEVVDMSDESTAANFWSDGTLIASSVVAVDPGVDILSNLVFSLLDPTGRAVILNSTNLPQRFGIRYSAYNSGGTNAVAGENRPANQTRNTVGVLNRSVPARTINATATAGYYKVSGVWQQVNSATFKSLDFTLSLSTDTPPVQILEPYGKYNLTSFKARLARILDGQTLAANVAVIGDSWANIQFILGRPIARKLRTLYGDAGPGYAGFPTAYTAGPATGNVDDAVVTVARTGTWATDSSSSAKGVDGFSISSSTVGDAITLTLTGTARRAVLHYYAQAAGGTVRWKVDAGAWTSISTVGTAGMATANIDFGSDQTGVVITIEVEIAGASGVILHGVDLKTDVAGVRVHKLGHSGGYASTLTAIDENIGYTQLAALAPDLALIVFSTNELINDIPPSTMIDNIKIIVQRIKECRPYCDIVLVCPSDNASETNVYKHADYEKAMYQLAFDLRCGFFPCKTVLGVHGDYFHNALVADTVPHPNSAGGELLGRSLANELLIL